MTNFLSNLTFLILCIFFYVFVVYGLHRDKVDKAMLKKKDNIEKTLKNNS